MANEYFTLTLKPNLNEPIDLTTDRSALLDYEFDACFSPEKGAYTVHRNDAFKVVVEVTAAESDLLCLSIYSMNFLSCPSPRGKGQLFTSIFREDPDHPDRQILERGTAKFKQRKKPGKKLVYDMTAPERIPFARPGDFMVTFILTIALQRDNQLELFNFIKDPEVFVEGSYP